jgi:hypothetical protein
MKMRLFTHSNTSRSSSSSPFMVFGILLLSLLPLAVDGVMGGGEGSGETASIVNCDEFLTSPVVFECPTDDPSTVLMASYVSRGSVDCGGALSIEQAAIAPKIKVTTTGNGEEDLNNNNAIDPTGLYTLLLVDTTALGGALGIFDGKAQQSYVHPILHYGAVNIEGSALIAGLSLDLQGTADDSSLLDVFSSYRGPNPPQPSDPWAIPDIENTLFAFEYMLGLQQTQSSSGDGDNNNGTSLLVDVPIDIENTQFDYESFFDEVGVDFNNIISTYFVSGWCVEEIEERTRTTHAPTASPPTTPSVTPETLSSSSSPDPVFASINNSSTNDGAKEDYVEVVDNSNNSNERSSLYSSSRNTNTTADVDDTTSSSSSGGTGTKNAFFFSVVAIFLAMVVMLLL